MTATLSPALASVTDFAISNQRQHFTFDQSAFVGIVFNTIGTEFFVSLQGFEHTRIEFSVFAAERAHGFAATGCDAMLVHGGAEASFVYVQILLFGDVAGDLEGQAVGGVQVEGFVPVEDAGTLAGSSSSSRVL